MTINIVSKSNPRLAQRYGSSVRSAAGVNAKRGAGFFDFDVHRELFLSGEQGLWLDPADMSRAKINWRRNLLTNSERFTSWTFGSSNVTANNETAPDATLTASTINRPGGAGYAITQTLTLIPNTVYTLTLYVKAGTQTTAAFGVYSNAVGSFSSGTASVISGSASLSGTTLIQVTGLTSSWTRLQLTFTSASSNTSEVYFYPVSSSSSSPTSGTNIIWGFQLELNPTPTEYQRITDFSTEFKAAFPQHALYQDSNGITPCTAAGDPVGLVIDKRLGGINTQEYFTLTNESFDSGSTGWTPSNSSVDTSNAGQVTVTSTSGGAYGLIDQNITGSVAGQWYLVEADVQLVSGTGVVGFWNGSAGNYSTWTSTERRTVKAISLFTALGAVRVGVTNSIGTSIIVYQVRVYRIYGNHAYQATSSSRPTLGRLPSSTGGVRNLITYSEELDNAVWTKVNGSITANATTSYDGSTTADLFVCNTTNSTHDNRRNETVKTSTTYTLSAYAKAQNYNFLWLNIVNPSIQDYQCWFNVSNGTVGTVAAGATAKIESVGNGWYRCQMTLTTTASQTTTIVVVAVSNANNTVSFAGDNASGVYIDKIQFEESPTATNYQKVRSTYDITEAGANDCWYLYFDGSDDFLLTPTINFPAWTLGSTRNYLDFTEPVVSQTVNSGVSDAAGFSTFNNSLQYTGGVLGYAYPALSLGSGITSTVSVFVIMDDTLAPAFGSSTVSNVANDFALVNRGNTIDPLTYTITSLGGGVYRVSGTGTTGSNANNNGVVKYATNSARGFRISGIQIEMGSVLTDYQKVGTDELTAIIGLRKLTDANSTVVFELSADAASNNGAFALHAPRIGGNANIDFRTRGTATVTIADTASTSPTTVVATIASDITADSAVLRKNGLQSSNSSSDQGTGDYGNHILYIGRRAGTSVPFNGHIYGLIVRGRSSSADLISNTEKFIARNTGLII